MKITDNSLVLDHYGFFQQLKMHLDEYGRLDTYFQKLLLDIAYEPVKVLKQIDMEINEFENARNGRKRKKISFPLITQRQDISYIENRINIVKDRIKKDNDELDDLKNDAYKYVERIFDDVL
jgi:hypothetical protein